MTWILFYLLDICKLLPMDVKSFEKVHLGPEIWPFENGLRKSVSLPQFLDKIDGYLLKTVIIN